MAELGAESKMLADELEPSPVEPQGVKKLLREYEGLGRAVISERSTTWLNNADREELAMRTATQKRELGRVLDTLGQTEQVKKIDKGLAQLPQK